MQYISQQQPETLKGTHQERNIEEICFRVLPVGECLDAGMWLLASTGKILTSLSRAATTPFSPASVLRPFEETSNRVGRPEV